MAIPIQVIGVMGVAGSGKTTVGIRLAAALGWQFADADQFHSPENVAKMHQGIPLSDADRLPWLQALQEAIASWVQAGTPTVIACSALKAHYRELMTQHSPHVRWVYLKGSPELLRQRLQHRIGHFAGISLLQSQLETLEEPQDALWVDVAQPPDAIVQTICEQLGLAIVVPPQDSTDRR